MNEVKFRGLDRYGKWHHGGYHKSWIYDENKQPETTYYIVDRYCNGILVEHIDQYTGLKDKNGREIYEGDIVAYLDSYDRSSESGYNFEEFMNKGEIIFNDKYGRFDVTNRSDIDYYDFVECVDEYEVIGNIYENPSLVGDSNV